MLEQSSQLREQYKVRLQEEIEKLTSPVTVPVPIRHPSTSSSMLSSEAAEFIPSSNLETSYYDYDYYQQEGYFPTCYPGYEPDYCYNDQFNVAYSQHIEPPQTGIEANILSNMLNILKTS